MTTGARRWSWVVCGGLLIAAAGLAAWSNWVNWMPCQGSMLLGTSWGGPYPGAGFSDACMDRMDNGSAFPVPGDPSLPQRTATMIGLVAQVMAGAAWLLLLTASSRPPLTGMAILPVAPSLAVVLMNGWFVLDPDQHVGLWSWIPLFTVDLAAVVSLIALVGGGVRKVLALVRVVVVLWGVSAFSLSHMLGDLLVTMSLSEASWDSPPGTGYLTAAVLLISGLVALTGAASRQPEGAVEGNVSPHDSAAVASNP